MQFEPNTAVPAFAKACIVLEPDIALVGEPPQSSQKLVPLTI